jgi:hypothetical protein
LVSSTTIEVHNDATGDLRAIARNDPVNFPKLYALLEQLRKDPSLRGHLLDNHFGADRSEPISVMQWIGVKRQAPLWRLKFWDLERHGVRYRLLYVFDWKAQTFVVLAVVQRDAFNYDDPNDPIRRRVLRCCATEYSHV